MHALETKLALAWPPAQWADVTVLVAVSGGCDSVALLRAMAALKTAGAGRLGAVHLNHGLRAEADADDNFVAELCGRLGVACQIGHAPVEQLAAERGDGIEEAARRARYAFLAEAAERFGARFVTTAHTADDQAETILHRIVRGTGIRGLAGMSRTRSLGHATLIRPLLSVRHAELQQYLRDLQQAYRCDESNADPRFTRNRIRHETMPHLRDRYNTNLSDALLRLGELAAESQAVVDHAVDQCLDRCATLDPPRSARLVLAGLERFLDAAATGRSRSYLARELLMAIWRRQGWPMQAMGGSKWTELGAMAISALPTPPRDFPGGITVEVRDGQMVLTARRNPQAG